MISIRLYRSLSLIILNMVGSLVFCQTNPLQELDLKNVDYKLYLLPTSERSTFTGVSLNNNSIKRLQQELVLEPSYEPFKCGSTHSLYLTQQDSIVAIWRIILSCDQISFGKKKYRLSSENLDQIVALGEALDQSIISFSTLEEARSYYEKNITTDTTIVLKEAFAPSWLKFEGWSYLSIVDSSRVGLKELLYQTRRKLGSSINVDLAFSSAEYLGDDLLPKYEFRFLCDHSFYEDFSVHAYGIEGTLSDRWNYFKDFKVRVFRKK